MQIATNLTVSSKARRGPRTQLEKLIVKLAFITPAGPAAPAEMQTVPGRALVTINGILRCLDINHLRDADLFSAGRTSREESISCGDASTHRSIDSTGASDDLRRGGFCALFAASRSLSASALSVARARAMRDINVPTGIASVAAASV